MIQIDKDTVTHLVAILQRGTEITLTADGVTLRRYKDLGRRGVVDARRVVAWEVIGASELPHLALLEKEAELFGEMDLVADG